MHLIDKYKYLTITDLPDGFKVTEIYRLQCITKNRLNLTKLSLWTFEKIQEYSRIFKNFSNSYRNWEMMKY